VVAIHTSCSNSQSVSVHFVFVGFCIILIINGDHFLKCVNQLNLVMVKWCVYFAVRTGFLKTLFRRGSASKG
jgi:hypothetical protein